jgi:hypothetical protein
MPCDLPKKYHSHSRHSGWRGTTQIMSFKYKVNIGAKLNPFSTGHSEQSIIIQDRIQRFNPLRINVTITDYPRGDIYFQITTVDKERRQRDRNLNITISYYLELIPTQIQRTKSWASWNFSYQFVLEMCYRTHGQFWFTWLSYTPSDDALLI